MQYRTVVPVLALVAVAACQHDKPTQPQAASQAGPAPSAANTARPNRPQRLAVSPYAVSITDTASGQTFTYDPTTSTVDNGVQSVVIEDDSLATAVLAEFAGTPIADAQVKGLTDAMNGGGRVKTTPIPTVSGLQGQHSTFQVRPGGRHLPITKSPIHPASFDIGITIPSEFGVGAGMPIETPLFQGLFNCTSVANAVVEGKAAYINRRSGFLVDLFNEVFETTTDLVFRLPATLAIAAHLGRDAAERANSRINVGVLAVMWNAYNCNSHQVIASEELILGAATGFGSNGGAPNEKCSFDPWEVSFDDWATFATIWVYTCYIKDT